MANVPRTRLDPSARRAQLVDLGVRMLSARALDQVAIDDIAAEAGISRGLLFHYFPTKHDYYVAVVEAAAGELYERTEPDPRLPVVERRRSAIGAFLDYVSENREAYTSLLTGGGGDAALRQVLDDTRTRMADRLLRTVGVPAPVPAHLRLAARGWTAFAEQVSIDWLLTENLDRAAVVTLMDEALVAILVLATRQS